MVNVILEARDGSAEVVAIGSAVHNRLADMEPIDSLPPPSIDARRPLPSDPKRTLGLLDTTAVGIGAIVGGGILVLAGVAFKFAGPAALLAFFFNGVLAILTALSFAEVSTRFPESGGVYTFAKKLLSVRAAFAVGWILWFAYIVAGVLYALGFASYAVELINVLYPGRPPIWLKSRTMLVITALIPAFYYSASLIRKSSGGGQWATWGKVIVFGILLAVGAVQLLQTDFHTSMAKLTPYVPEGATGVLQAMGLTFIALQGFDLISAVAGEIKDPERTIPRAMLLSLGVALLIYIPLILIVSTVGTPNGSNITELSQKDPETVMARAAHVFMGPLGYWLVMVAALLSTLSALQANMLAASRIAHSMAEDRTLPAVLSQIHPRLHTPHMAIYASGLTLVALLLAVPDLAAAGSAASLIFLIAFALAHGTAILARRRGNQRQSQQPPAMTSTLNLERAPPFKAPFFPLIPVVGGIACACMATFQALAEPAAGGVALVWLGLGGLLYVGLFSDRAEIYDAFAEARDPLLAKMRGRSPLVLVPVANPNSAQMMVEVAAALAPPRVGRVMLLRVMSPPEDGNDALIALEQAQRVMAQALHAALQSGHRPEGLVTIASRPWFEIGRVVRSHLCQGLVLGLPQDVSALPGGELEALINSLDCDVTLVRGHQNLRPSAAHKILVPVGRQGHDVAMRARVLGSLQTQGRPEITWLSIIPASDTKESEATSHRKLLAIARDNVYGDPILKVVRSDHPIDALVQVAADHELLVLGMHRGRDGKRLFGSFNTAVLAKTQIATLLIGGAGRG